MNKNDKRNIIEFELSQLKEIKQIAIVVNEVLNRYVGKLFREPLRTKIFEEVKVALEENGLVVRALNNNSNSRYGNNFYMWTDKDCISYTRIVEWYGEKYDENVYSKFSCELTLTPLINQHIKKDCLIDEEITEDFYYISGESGSFYKNTTQLNRQIEETQDLVEHFEEYFEDALSKLKAMMKAISDFEETKRDLLYERYAESCHYWNSNAVDEARGIK